MKADEKLKALFAEDMPRARDLVFQESVLQALARKIFWQELSILAAACGSAVVLIWMVAPSLEPLLIQFGRLLTPGLVIMVLGVLLFAEDLRRSRFKGL
ncbi:MAG: hypothetical protein CFE28_08985 [Alphaproteobacteria bacterium PA2]|nr:MAG: hypothetical protein CFE28_08985 [Alphaproteobacteria bacterium PA2]